MTKILIALAVILGCAAPAAAQLPPPLPPAPPAAPDRLDHLTLFPPVDWPDVQFDFDALAIELDAVAMNLEALAWPPLLAQAPVPEPAPAPPKAPAPPVPVLKGSSEESWYEQARNYIERDQFDRAIPALDRVIAAGGSRGDAAMYWKAYSLSKVARAADALATLDALQKQFPRSRWISDARALELEVRQATGQAVSAAAQADDETRLLALQGLMRTDPEAALPIVEKLLAGTASVRVKERALFVIGRSRSARAREVITNVAKGASNPDLRLTAVRYLGMMSGAESRQALEEIYRGSNDTDLKKAILRSFAIGNATDKLAVIARSESDADLRRTAIRSLGMSNRPDAAETLVAIYNADTTVETRRAVIDALSMHRNGAPLIALARAEKNPELKKEIVRRLSTMRSPEVRDYLVELLK